MVSPGPENPTSGQRAPHFKGSWPLRVDEEGWLEAQGDSPALKHYPTVRTTPLAVPRPLGVVWHWTAGRGGPGFGEALARWAQGYRRGIDSPASWHLLIAKDGAVYQSAPFAVGTWHVGRPGIIAGRRFANINAATVGVELENAGRLRRLGDGIYCWPYYTNPLAPEGKRQPDRRYALEAGRALATREGLFDAFPPAQVSSAVVVLRALAARYDWTRDVSAYGHVDFDSPRKEDPGPVWKQAVLPRILDTVFGGGTSAPASNAGTAGQGG